MANCYSTANLFYQRLVLRSHDGRELKWMRGPASMKEGARPHTSSAGHEQCWRAGAAVSAWSYSFFFRHGHLGSPLWLPELKLPAQKSLDECPLGASNLALVEWVAGVRFVFAQLHPGTSTQRRVLVGSLALHGLLFAWLMHAPEPELLMPSSVAIGSNGRVVGASLFSYPNARP